MIRVAVFILGMLVSSAVCAATGNKVALVVGNSDYRNTPSLANPKNDAVKIAAVLRSLDFDVSLVTDASQDAFGDALLSFENKLDGASHALFFYAGHGMQLRGENYLLSVDAKIQNHHLIDSEAVKLSQVLEMMESRAQVSIALVDACRDNPLANALQDRLKDQGRSLGLGRGLARIDEIFRDSLVAFATAPGTIAYDGAGENSPFTQALLKHIDTPGIEVSTMLKRVSADVLTTTEGKQRPEVVSQMSREFYFNGTIELNVTTDNQSALEQSAADLLDVARSIPNKNARKTALELVSTKFPDTGAAAMARLLADQIEGDQVAASEPEEPQNESTARQSEQSSGQRTQNFASLIDDSASSVESSQSGSPKDVEQALALTPADYQEVQRVLNAMGYSAGAVDGVFGSRSREALKSFQIASRIEGSGYLTEGVLERLARAYNSTPDGYDGIYNVTVSRRWDDPYHRRNPDPWYSPGRIEVLAMLRVRRVGDELILVSAQDFSRTEGDWFEDFEGTLTDAGRMRMSFTQSYLFDVVRPHRTRIDEVLPERLPTNRTIEFEEGMFDPAFHIRIGVRRVQ